MQQLTTLNFGTKGTVGMCLSYAEDFFGVPHDYSNATQAWSATTKRHYDANFPTDVAVPIWFSYWDTISGVYANYGHVAINVPGKGIYSSPWRSTDTYAILSSVAGLQAIYSNNGKKPLVYLGWTEDISGITVIGENMDKITKEQEQSLAEMQTGSYPGKDYNYKFTGLDLTQDNLDAMLQFWSGMARPVANDSQYVKVSDLYIKKS